MVSSPRSSSHHASSGGPVLPWSQFGPKALTVPGTRGRSAHPTTGSPHAAAAATAATAGRILNPFSDQLQSVSTASSPHSGSHDRPSPSFSPPVSEGFRRNILVWTLASPATNTTCQKKKQASQYFVQEQQPSQTNCRPAIPGRRCGQDETPPSGSNLSLHDPYSAAIHGGLGRTVGTLSAAHQGRSSS